MRMFNALSRLFGPKTAVPVREVPTLAGPVRHAADPYLVLGNPIRDLNPVYAASLFEQAMRGEFTRIQWVMYHAEQADADLFALRDRRASSVLEMEWRCKEVTGDDVDEALAKEQSAALKAHYEGIKNIYEAIEHLQSAIFRGYAHLAIGKDRLEPLDQWWWLRDGLYGDWYFNPDGRLTSPRLLREVEPIQESDWIIREEHHSLRTLAVTKFLRSTYSQRWWNDFCERVSRQSTIVIGPESMPESDRSVFESAAREISKGGSGYLPNTSQVLFSDNQRGPIPFEAHMRFLSEKIVLAGTGGKLTMLAEATGIGPGATPAHQEAFDSLARRDARVISELFQESIDARVLEELFPGKPVLAYFELAANEEPDVGEVIDQLVKLSSVDLRRFDIDDISERTGFNLQEPEPMPVPPGLDKGEDPEDGDPVPNRAPAVARAIGVPENWLAPVADLLTQIEAKLKDQSISDDDLLAFLDAAAVRIPELFADMDTDSLAEVLEAGMADQVVDGVRQGLKRRAHGGTVPNRVERRLDGWFIAGGHDEGPFKTQKDALGRLSELGKNPEG